MARNVGAVRRDVVVREVPEPVGVAHAVLEDRGQIGRGEVAEDGAPEVDHRRSAGYLVGPYKHAYLTLLEVLHYYGRKQSTDMYTEGLLKGNAIPLASIAHFTIPASGIRRAIAVPSTPDANNNVRVRWKGDKISPFDKFQKHRTFTILTPDGIYTRMYMKTINYNRDVNKNGLDVIEWTAIFERFS